MGADIPRLFPLDLMLKVGWRRGQLTGSGSGEYVAEERSQFYVSSFRLIRKIAMLSFVELSSPGRIMTIHFGGTALGRNLNIIAGKVRVETFSALRWISGLMLFREISSV